MGYQSHFYFGKGLRKSFDAPEREIAYDRANAKLIEDEMIQEYGIDAVPRIMCEICYEKKTASDFFAFTCGH